jgi:hypothetical protein
MGGGVVAIFEPEKSGWCLEVLGLAGFPFLLSGTSLCLLALAGFCLLGKLRELDSVPSPSWVLQSCQAACLYGLPCLFYTILWSLSPVSWFLMIVWSMHTGPTSFVGNCCGTYNSQLSPNEFNSVVTKINIDGVVVKINTAHSPPHTSKYTTMFLCQS